MSEFLCLNFKSQTVFDLDDVISKEGQKEVYVFYGHQSMFNSGSEAKIVKLIGDKLKDKSLFLDYKILNFVDHSEIENTLDTAIYSFAKDFPKNTHLQLLGSLNGDIRKKTIAKAYSSSPLIILSPSIVLDLANSPKESLFSSLNNVQEYVVWYDKGLSNKTFWGKKDNQSGFQEAWMGNGFPRWRYKPLHKELNTCFQIPSGFEQAMEAGLSQLCEYEKFLEKVKTKTNHSVFKSDPGDFIDKLLDYLPAYQHQNYLVATSCRLPSEAEGPTVWLDIWELDYYQRQLLLDGWLTLWDDGDGGLLLQPASLALLYWAAKRSQYPKTSTPDEFMECYFDSKNQPAQFRNSLGWFGGNI